MRNSVRLGECVWAVVVDPATGREILWDRPLHVVRIHQVVEFYVAARGGSYMQLFTTDEGSKWCRDDPEDLAALKALVTMAL